MSPYPPVPSPTQPGLPGPVPYDPQRPPYPAGASSPGAGWPPAVSAGSAPTSGAAPAVLTAALLALGAVLSLAYASWAFSARRGIFQDFADGHTVSVDDAKSSDLLDTVWLLFAGLVAVIALGLWLSRMLTKKTSGGLADTIGLIVALLGAVAVTVGLALSNGVSAAADSVSQGERGVGATEVVGGGFAFVAVGLLMGFVAVWGGRDAARRRAGIGPAAPYQGW